MLCLRSHRIWIPLIPADFVNILDWLADWLFIKRKLYQRSNTARIYQKKKKRKEKTNRSFLYLSLNWFQLQITSGNSFCQQRACVEGFTEIGVSKSDNIAGWIMFMVFKQQQQHQQLRKFNLATLSIIEETNYSDNVYRQK